MLRLSLGAREGREGQARGAHLLPLRRPLLPRSAAVLL